jgi:hypothetical protein
MNYLSSPVVSQIARRVASAGSGALRGTRSGPCSVRLGLLAWAGKVWVQSSIAQCWLTEDRQSQACVQSMALCYRRRSMGWRMRLGKTNEVQGGKMLGGLHNVSPKQQGLGPGGEDCVQQLCWVFSEWRSARLRESVQVEVAVRASTRRARAAVRRVARPATSSA